MNDFSTILKKLRKSKGLNQEELAAVLGVRKTTISNYETGYSTPGGSMLRQIADYFQVSTGMLLGDSVSLRESAPGADPAFVSIPVYASLSAEEGASLPLYQIQLPLSLMGEGHFFAVTVSGDRMDRSALSDGSIAIIRKQNFADNGDVVLLSVGSDPAIFGRLYRFGTMVSVAAESSNPMYHPVIVNNGEQPVTILGKVIKVLQSI
ncbi:MAG: helix-turn-helix domain-containing protein [Ruminococcaceae bacterium]|nr:helix-turn-helix domain-containing protein [Oscillospiraceae bacterium]